MSAKDEKNLEQVLSKIAGLDEPERSALQRMHEVILAAAPQLKPRIWYGMPGYAASASTPVLVFVRADESMTLGVGERAARVTGGPEDGRLRPSAWFFDAVDHATERRVADIVRAAVG